MIDPDRPRRPSDPPENGTPASPAGGGEDGGLGAAPAGGGDAGATTRVPSAPGNGAAGPEPAEAEPVPPEPGDAAPATVPQATEGAAEDEGPGLTVAGGTETAPEPGAPPEREAAPDDEAARGEIEWQPVYDGDQISWQPVVAPGYGDEAEPEEWEEWETGVSSHGQAEQPEVDSAWDGEEDHREPAAGPPAPPARPPEQAKQRRMVVLLSVLTGVVVLTALIAWSLSNGITRQSSGRPEPTTATSRPSPTLPESELDTFHDAATGVTVKYPKRWRRLGAPSSDVLLWLEAGGRDAMLVRLYPIPIETPATPDNIGNLKTFTDGIIALDRDNRVIQSQLVQLNGRLAYYYLYTFRDTVSGQEGVHLHWFVFEGHRIFSMVFQAVPSEDIRALEGIFNQIAASFTVAQESSLPTTTTLPPATTPPTTG